MRKVISYLYCIIEPRLLCRNVLEKSVSIFFKKKDRNIKRTQKNVLFLLFVVAENHLQNPDAQKNSPRLMTLLTLQFVRPSLVILTTALNAPPSRPSLHFPLWILHSCHSLHVLLTKPRRSGGLTGYGRWICLIRSRVSSLSRGDSHPLPSWQVWWISTSPLLWTQILRF